MLTRLNEMRDEHDRIGEECRKRFNRVEVVTQWIFSGMSHRLFLEWARRWKEDLALADRQRKENGTSPYGSHGGGDGSSGNGAVISGDSWRGAGPNLGAALGLVAANHPTRTSGRSGVPVQVLILLQLLPLLTWSIPSLGSFHRSFIQRLLYYH